LSIKFGRVQLRLWTKIAAEARLSGQGQSVGNATGDSKLEGECKADQFKGKVRNALGGLKNTLRGK